MKTRKVRPRQRTYDVICDAVRTGATLGVRRASKHLDAGQRPTDESLVEHVERAVVTELCEALTWDEDD